MKRGLLTVALLACSVPEGPNVSTGTLTPVVALSLVDGDIVVVRGESAPIPLIVSSNTLSQPEVTLELAPLPSGLSATTATWNDFDSTAITLEVSAATNAPATRFTFEVRAVSEGKIVATATGSLAVSNEEGSPDPTFGTNGVLELPNGTVAQPAGIAPATNGTFVIGGFDMSTRVVAIRMLADGTIDTTYGDQGIAAAAPALVPTARAVAMAAASDGRIAIAMVDSTAGTVVTFDAGGKALATTEVPFSPSSIAWDGDGLFVGGSYDLAYIDASQNVSTLQPQLGVASLQLVGPSAVLVGGKTPQNASIAKWSFSAGHFTLDATYGQGGTATLPVQASVTALARDPSGHTLAALGGTEVGVARLDPNGVLDAAYGSGGVALVTPSVTASADVVSSPAGEALLVTTVPPSNATSIMGAALLARLTPSGEADASFGTYAGTLTEIATGTRPAALTLDADATHAYVTGDIDYGGGVGGYVARYRLSSTP